MNLDKIQKRITKNIQRYEMLDAKGIASELIDVLGEHNLAVADAIDILELAKHKILVMTKIKPSGQNLINVKKAVQAIMLDCLNTPSDEFSKVLQSEKK